MDVKRLSDLKCSADGCCRQAVSRFKGKPYCNKHWQKLYKTGTLEKIDRHKPREIKPYFFLGKYLIALYDSDDFPFVVADNIRELSEMTNKKKQCLASTIANNSKYLCVDGHRYTIHLIPIN